MSRDECATPDAKDGVEGGDREGDTTLGKVEPNTENPLDQLEEKMMSTSDTDTRPTLIAGVEEVVNFINFDKLLEPGSSSHYGISEANRSQRQLLEKIKKKKRDSGVSPLDVSTHRLRVNVLGGRVCESSYRGPAPLKRDGSHVTPVIKGLGRGSTHSDSGLLPAQEVAEVGSQKLKRCSFSCVDIREHERIAGDNPCVSKGVPLSIGWGFYQHESIDLDNYEANKGPARDKIEMMVPAEIRKQILLKEFNVSLNDINTAIKSVNISKKQRRQTVANEHLEGWEEAVQSAKRKLNRFTKKTSKSKEEEKLWADAQKNARTGKV